MQATARTEPYMDERLAASENLGSCLAASLSYKNMTCTAAFVHEVQRFQVLRQNADSVLAGSCVNST
ncbi:hypothetical protein DPX16_5069 [Anabarilius grahami]|uniref:Uncharacterized protein n=1 Tax=Anabarilius grahami TaxID=495550 RepID=A0A3N0XJ15_ANAGA|nr:hypothetical protein DPX16_5069 [Anabarilius grahami]